jgi:hypothetical protein
MGEHPLSYATSHHYTWAAYKKQHSVRDRLIGVYLGLDKDELSQKSAYMTRDIDNRYYSHKAPGCG